MIAPNLEDIYTQGCLDLQLRETGAADDTTITELAFLLPLAVRQYQRLDQDDPSVDAPVFARLSPAERNGCALLWLALSGGDVANVSEARGLEHHIRTLRMDRLALEKVFGNLDFDAEHLEILPAWARAGFAIFQFALESGDTGDVFVELPAQLDIDGADFDSWLQTTDSPAFWHILVEHHVGLLSPDAIHWILSRPDCDIGTAASFLFRFGLLSETVGASQETVAQIFEGQAPLRQVLPKMTPAAMTEILFALCHRAERRQFGPAKFASRFGPGVDEQHKMLVSLATQVVDAGQGALPLPMALLTRPLASRVLVSPYTALSRTPDRGAVDRPVGMRGLQSLGH